MSLRSAGAPCLALFETWENAQMLFYPAAKTGNKGEDRK